MAVSGEEARVETVRKRIEETTENEVTLAQWAKVVGMSRNSQQSSSIIFEKKALSLYTVEGNLELLRGAKNKVSTYVYWWIRQAITRPIAKKSKITRLRAICTIILNAESAAYTSTFPKFIMGSVSELVPRICEANAILSRRLWKLPTCQEIAEAVKRDILTVELALERYREPISLDQPIVAGASISLQEIVAGPDETTPEAMLKKQFMKRDMEKLLNHSTR
ncbi:RNA polymerase sigma factor sigD, chloroplastic-like [Coffea arabica]|uniref:RNA polymerase sigma factor sigD, chloroplastic-like n=1 Tax=Coffea arabica TaxID=13443 RepID=A0ABM4WPB3_COFAR